MFLLDFLIYVIFAFVMAFFAHRSCVEDCRPHKKGKPKFWNTYLILFVSFFTLISAIRWNVGSDAISYAQMFAKGIKGNKGEDLFVYMTDVVRIWHLHWSFGLGLMAFIEIYFITKSAKGFKYILVALPFVMFCGRYWMDLSGACRQMMVAAIFLWASRYIYSKNIWKFAIVILVCTFIHQSALILIPLFLIPSRWHFENRRIALTVILMTCFIIGLAPSFQSFVKFLEPILELTGYEDYTATSEALLEMGETKEALAFGPMMLSYLLIPLLIIWFGPTLRAEYQKKIVYFDLWYNLAFLYSCLYFLVCNISHLFIRPTMYLVLFQMMMASILLYYLWRNYRRSAKNLIYFVFVSIVLLTNTFWDVYKSSGKEFEISTYKVFFTHEKQVKKFDL